MALTSTVYTCAIDLADHDREVYDTLSLRLARHPSESTDFFWTRLLAFALESGEGLAFSSGGLSDPEEPALMRRDLTGARLDWIEVGLPDVARLQRALKAAPRVAVYAHRDPSQWLRRLAGERLNPVKAFDIYAMDRGLLAALESRLDRRLDLALSVADSELHVSIGADTLVGRVERCPRP